MNILGEDPFGNKLPSTSKYKYFGLGFNLGETHENTVVVPCLILPPGLQPRPDAEIPPAPFLSHPESSTPSQAPEFASVRSAIKSEGGCGTQ